MKNDFLRETKFSFTRYLWPIIFLITELKVLFNRFQKDLEFSTIASILESFSISLFQSFLKRLLFSRLMIFLFWSTISSRENKTRLWLLTKAVYPRVGHVHRNIAEIVRLVLVLAELERIWGIVTISHNNSNDEFLVQHKCMFIRKWGLWKTLKTKKILL